MLYVIFSKKWSFRVDWRKIHELSKAKMVLITEQAGLDKMPIEQRSSFTQILVENDFSQSNLIEKCLEIFGNHQIKNPNNEIRFITVDERLTHIAGMLRDHFNVAGDSGVILEKFRNKHVMKQVLAGSKISIPKHVLYDPELFKKDEDNYAKQVINQLGLPIFAKPVDGGGGRDGSTIFNKQQLIEWCKNHISDTKYANYELDQFISGTYYHIDMIFQGGKCLFTEICRHAVPNYTALKEILPFSYFMLSEDEPEYKKMLQFSRDVLEAMHPVPRNSVFDLDCCMTEQGEIYFIEIAARSPGGTNPQMYAQAYNGMNIEEVHVRLQLGLSIEPIKRNNLFYASFGVPRGEGVIQKLHIPDIRSTISNLEWQVKPGKNYSKALGMSDTVCTFVIAATNKQQLLEDFEKVNHFQFATQV